MNLNICPVTFVFPNMECLSLYAWCCLQLSCKLNLDRTVYTVFRNIRYLNTVFSKQNISCFEIRWPRPIWSVNVFFMHSASAVDIYRGQRKHINYSILPMRISRHDLRRRYSNSLVIDAGSQFSLRACSRLFYILLCLVWKSFAGL
jgi:hypothetical protein